MATENRRVAAYLPKEIGDQLEDFKLKSGIKSDSPALIAILSEYFGVSREVTYPSGSSLMQRLENLENQSSELRSELFGELRNLVQRLDAVEVELRTTSFGEKELYDTPGNILGKLPIENSITDNPIEDQPNEGNPIAKEDLNQDNSDRDSVLLEKPPSELLSEEFAGDFQNKPKTTNEILIGELENEPSIEVMQSESPDGLPADIPNNAESELFSESSSESSSTENRLLFPDMNKTDERISVPAVKLASRLGIDRKKLAKLWDVSLPEEFARLTSEKDPDGIAWKYLPGRKGLTPASELEGESLSRLLSWRNDG